MPTNMQGGPREGVAETYNTLLAGQETIGTVSQPLVDDDMLIFSVLIQNPTGSGRVLYVGNNDMQPVVVVAGREITLRVRRLNLVHVRADGPMNVNWIAEA